MLKFCFLKSSIPIKDEICTKITSVLFPTLNDMILAETPENLCSNAAVLFVEPKKQELENFEGTGCDICLMVVMKIDEALEDETKEVSKFFRKYFENKVIF
jgi:MinD superfamily P-loop ATPase